MLVNCVFSQANFSIAQAKRQNASVTSPEEVARQFYRWYITAEYPQPRKEPTKFRRYITQRCLKKAITARDYVYFISAQDTDPKWKDGIVVSTAKIRGSKATVQVTLKGQDFSVRAGPVQDQENGAWKIDNVTPRPA